MKGDYDVINLQSEVAFGFIIMYFCDVDEISYLDLDLVSDPLVRGQCVVEPRAGQLVIGPRVGSAL